jgi:hypothetical protein
LESETPDGRHVPCNAEPPETNHDVNIDFA